MAVKPQIQIQLLLVIAKCDREGVERHKDGNVYLDSTKSNSSWFHSLILSKSKVVVSRT